MTFFERYSRGLGRKVNAVVFDEETSAWLLL